MLSICETHPKTSPGLSRRELLRIGGVGMLGLSLPHLLGRRVAAAPDSSANPLFGRAKNIIYLFLAGGPSQYETFDPKPEAPAEIKGSFQPIATTVPGMHFCELLPRVARIADKLAVVRSFATDDPNHESGGYWVNTGYKYTGPNSRSINPTDWPTLGSIVKMLRPSDNVPFSTVALPEPIVANPNVLLPGHNAGFLGSRWDPDLFNCDPSAEGFQIEGLAAPVEVPALRLLARGNLLDQIERVSRFVAEHPAARDHDRLTRESLDLVVSGAVRGAFSLDR